MITPAVQSGLVTEDTDGAANENAETHHQSGTISFTDVDLTDVETSSITSKQLSATLSNGYALTSAQHDALVNAFTIERRIAFDDRWHRRYCLALRSGRQRHRLPRRQRVVTLTFTVQVADGHGGTDTQNVTITVHGTEDKPVIVSGPQSGLVTEDADGAANENTETPPSNRRRDLHRRRFVRPGDKLYRQYASVGDVVNGYILTSAQHDALVNAFTIGSASHSKTDGGGSIAWHYDLADSAIDFLGANES